MKLIVDVRTREEYYRSHIKGALNIPVFDLEFSLEFLKDKDVLVYCHSGNRAGLAVEYLMENGVKAEAIPADELDGYEWEEREIVCALNYLSVKPGLEEEFEEKAEELCRITVRMNGFLGSKVFKASTISYGGTGLQGEYEDIEIKPQKYIMLTYWTSKATHENFHKEPVILDGFLALMKYLSIMPYEEYVEIMR